MTVKVPSHVRIMTQTWDLGVNDGLGTVRDDPDYYCRGLSRVDDRFLNTEGIWKQSGIRFNRYAQKRKIEWPHKGYVQSYPIRLQNDIVITQFQFSVVQAGGLSDAIATAKDAGILWWFSRTPGGEPLATENGVKFVDSMFRVERIFYDMYQRYSIKDPDNSKGDVNVNPGTGILLPIINKTYYFNFAGVTSATSNQCTTSQPGGGTNPNPRAPRADELVKFPATDIGGRGTLSFISTSAQAWIDYDTYIRNVT